MEPGDTRLRQLGCQVQRDGFAFAEGAGVDPLLQSMGGIEDWQRFAASWDNLEPDLYLEATGRRRRRRHAVFTCGPAGGAAADCDIHRLPPRPHFQATAHNPLQGGIERWFAPMEDAATGASFHAFVRLGRRIFGALADPVASWFVEAHQFRIEAGPDHPGEPTPEGMHRDGVDYVLVAMIARRNIESGTTSIHAPDGGRLGSFTLTRPRDIALVDDNRVLHGVTAVTPQSPAAAAYRDVLVLTYRRWRPG